MRRHRSCVRRTLVWSADPARRGTSTCRPFSRECGIRACTEQSEGAGPEGRRYDARGDKSLWIEVDIREPGIEFRVSRFEFRICLRRQVSRLDSGYCWEGGRAGAASGAGGTTVRSPRPPLEPAGPARPASSSGGRGCEPKPSFINDLASGRPVGGNP
jgi:hypothetical protein